MATSPDELLRNVEALFKEEKFQEIIDLLTDDLLQTLNHANLYAWAARACNANDKKQEALVYVNQAISIDESSKFSFFVRGIIYSEKEYDKAIQDYTEAISLDNNYAAAYNNRGALWINKNEYNKAIEDLTRAISLDKNDAFAYSNRGAVWSNKKEYDKAIEDYTETIRLDNNNANAYYNRGNAWANKKEYDKAIKDYTEVISLDNTYALAYNNRGIAWYYKNEYHEAINDYTDAIRLDNNFATAYNNRGSAWYCKNQYHKAIQDYTDAIRLDNNDARAYINRGLAWANKKEYDEAIVDYTEAINLNNNYADAYINRGVAWAYKKEYDKAIEDYTETINLDNNYAAAYNKRGSAWNNKQEYDKAIEDYTEAVNLDNNFADAYNNRGNAWTGKQEYDKAIEDYTEAVNLDNNFADAYYNRGNVWAKKKEYDKAIVNFTDAIGLNNNYAAAYFNRGNAWANKKEYDKAIEDYTETISLDKNNGGAYNNRGIVWADKKKYDKAIKDYTEAIILDNTDASAYNNRGVAWAKKGEYDKAIEDSTEAVRLDNNFTAAYNNRGSAWAEKGKYDKAIEDFTEAIRLDNNYAAAYFNMAKVYQTLNKISLSLSFLNKASFLKYEVTELLRAYHENFTLPFMLRRVLMRLGNVSEIHTLLDTYGENTRYCENWNTVLTITERENKIVERQSIILQIKAIVNYFMGDCIESFRIYDVDIDSDDIYSLTLRDQYYYIKSAQDFLEPFENNLDFALKQSETDAKKSIENRYYIGQLLMIKNDYINAEHYFLDAASFGFRPALYQLAGLYDNQLLDTSRRNAIIEKIQESEKKNIDKYSLINGLDPLVIDDTKTDLLTAAYDLCRYYAYYAENIEEIQLVRNMLSLNTPYKQYEFWELIQFDKDCEEAFAGKMNEYELIEFEEKLFQAFDLSCKIQGESDFMERILNSNQATDLLRDIKSTITEYGSNYEKELAKKIADMKRTKVMAKWFLVLAKLYYLRGLLTAREVMCLHLYAHYVSITVKDTSIEKDINSEIQVWVSQLFTLSSPLLTKLLFQSFLFIRDGSTSNSQEKTFEDYLEFKDKYYEHLSFWKKNLAKQFIEEDERDV
jgi:tetratricopeptide (TPR) repeat protein